MTWSVYQHWDPLRVCVVGRSYPPEFYSWIKNPRVRNLFEQIAIETEEDFQKIIDKLQSFGVEVLRPKLPENPFWNGRYIPPPMTPRDYTIMIGDKFYYNYIYSKPFDFVSFYTNVKDPAWPNCQSLDEFENLPSWIKKECRDVHKIDNRPKEISCYDDILKIIKDSGNDIKYYIDPQINGAMVSRIGQDLYFSTESYYQDTAYLEKIIDIEFPLTRNHIINTGGHGDGTYCPVCPGLIISLHDVPTYADTFPGWEVVYLPNQSWDAVKPFLDLKNRNKGRWWIPGFEYDNDVIDVIDTWMDHWVGCVEETVFDVNMLIVDPKNVMVFNYNKQVFDVLSRYGITPHVVNFRHRYFWDGGIHCVTSDLHRKGTSKDYFPGRS